MTCVETTGDLYYIMWSTRGLEYVLNYTLHDKELIVNLLMEKVDASTTSNPIRAMIVEGMIRGRPFEIWQVNSVLTEEEIIMAFDSEGETIKQEIRSTGELLFSN